MSGSDANDADAPFITTEFIGSAPADTAGWDTVYALKVGLINQALARTYGPDGPQAAKLAFSQRITPSDPNSASMQGQFGAWQIATGGSGQHINLTLPIRSGTATLTGIGLPTPTVDLAGAQISVLVSLGFHAVETGSQAPSSGAAATTAHLKVVTGGSAPAAGSAAAIKAAKAGAATTGGAPSGSGNAPVTVTGVTGVTLPAADSELASIATTFIQALATAWIADNLDLFDYVFLSVDVAETAATGEWAWIRPTYVGYAVTDLLGADGTPLPVEHSLFAIMSLTEGRMPGVQPDGSTIAVSSTVSVNAIPNNSGVNAGFLIQPGLLLEKIIAVNMPSLFGEVDGNPVTFQTSTDSLTVTNTSKITLQLQMDRSWYPFSDTCQATIDVGDLTVAFNQTTVQQSFNNITFPYGLQDELNVTLTLDSHSAIGLDSNKKFTMHYGGYNTSTLSAQPDAKKVAWEALEGIAVNLVTMMGLCFIFGGTASEAAPAAEAGETAGTLGQTAGGKVASGTITSEVSEAPNAEALSPEGEQVAQDIQNGIANGEKAGGELTLNASKSNIGANLADSELAQTAKAELKNPGTWTFKGLMSRFTFKVWAMFVGQFAGQLYSEMSSIDTIRIYDYTADQIPTLQDFLADCIAPATWTNTGDQQLVCAGLNGAFVMGFTVPVDAAPAANGGTGTAAS